MSNHTPGPWKSDEKIVGWQGGDLPSVRVSYMSSEYTSSPIALCEARYLGEREAIANARLIAAAPEMLSLLTRLLNCGDWYMSALEINTYGADAEDGEKLEVEIKSLIAKAAQP